jgi:SAM-dependent methyltransferase
MAEANFDYCSAMYASVVKSLPTLIDCDWETILHHAGVLTGKSILELGCGEGSFLRFLRSRSADGRLVGVDISEGMLAVARSFEASQTSRIEYRSADITCGEALGQFDLVLAPFVFSLAGDRAKLVGMFRTAAASLRAGGRLLIYDDNVFLPPSDYAKTPPYGFTKWLGAPAQDGDRIAEGTPIHYRVGEGETSFPVTATFLPWDAWVAAAGAAGLTTPEWLPLKVSAVGIDIRGHEFWRDCVELPIFMCLSCTRP